ncbi:MAG TPA: hypothetical protein VD993_04900 [Chitinophagaceae bacterium]|nr:hypothetical protein [Chitinophagaceae bacterium]
MYNPFPLLTHELLRERIKAGKRYFVRQTYPRGKEARLRAAFLLRGYKPDEKQLAEEHISLLKGDANAFLYDIEQSEHLAKLNVAASQPFGFKVFYAGKIGSDWKPPTLYEGKIRKYLRWQFPQWQPEPGGEPIKVGICEEFGNLFLKLSFGDEEYRIPFEDIEKL